MITISVNQQSTVTQDTVQPGTTVGAWLRAKNISLNSNYVRRTNETGSLSITLGNADTTYLAHADQISITPTKQNGAALA